MLGISDSFMVVYDSDNFTALGQINESKGVLSYSVHERSSLLCTISKRKISLFLWQGFGFILRREIPLADTPRTCYCLDGVVVLGHKKWYEAVETSAYTTTRLLDVEKEHKMICMEVCGHIVQYWYPPAELTNHGQCSDSSGVSKEGFAADFHECPERHFANDKE